MTQEYVPDTDAIKLAYALSRDDRKYPARDIAAWDAIKKEAFEAFDRWLAAHDAQIRAEASSEALELVTSRELNVGVNAAYKDDLLTPASSALQKAMRAIAQYRKEQQ